MKRTRAEVEGGLSTGRLTGGDYSHAIYSWRCAGRLRIAQPAVVRKLHADVGSMRKQRAVIRQRRHRSMEYSNAARTMKRIINLKSPDLEKIFRSIYEGCVVVYEAFSRKREHGGSHNLGPARSPRWPCRSCLRMCAPSCGPLD